jgi:hypothetical protein
MTIAFQGDETEIRNVTQYLEDSTVGPSESAFRNIKCISQPNIIVPNIIIYPFMEWATSFLKYHSKIDNFNQLWAIMPPYPGFS